jgi:hypothetical protein
MEHARRGHRDAAKDDLARAGALTGERERYAAASLHLAAGDANGALALLAPNVANIALHPPSVQLRVHHNHALALAHLGRFEEGYHAAEAAYVAATRAEKDVVDRADPSFAAQVQLSEDKVAAAWLWAALAVRIGKATEVRPVLEQVNTEEMAQLTEWVELASMAENARRPVRFEMGLRNPPVGALPAAIYLVARAVQPDADVEVWLDRVFDDLHRRAPLQAMLARAEAARWRLAAEDERRWLDRAGHIRRRIRDLPTAFLAHLAELR